MTPALRTVARAAADGLLVALFAPCCAACNCALPCPSRGPVCAACWNSIRRLDPPLCRTCGDPLPSWRIVGVTMERCARCRRHESFIDAGRAAGEYEGALRGIIHAFKYEGRRSLARPLGALMCSAGADVLRDADCAVPVPLHMWRRLRRGFNQSADLARTLEVPLVHALWRSRHTAPQMGLSAGARRRNVTGAFTMSPRLSARDRAMSIEDRVVVLVDDVRTTGATLEACAMTLKDAGAREVRAVTAARAAAPITLS